MAHANAAFRPLRIAVLTVSDRRTRATDGSGDLLQARLEAAGHALADRDLVPDDVYRLRAVVSAWIVRPDVEVVLTTGGTGFSPRDRTPEALVPLLDREIPGFGELFRWLSYAEIGAATILSRALGGLLSGKVVLALPGSPKALRLALERIVLPEAGHLVSQARGR